MSTPGIHVGTCSWSEKSLIESGEFYPRGVSSPEARLRFYADHFDTVEVDATYYAIPPMHTVELWAQRTPAPFVFHIKAYGALTGHGIDPRTLPKALRELLPAPDREQRSIQVNEPELIRAIAGAFTDSLAPLRAAGKLGLVVFQYPPWFRCKPAAFDYILQCRELLDGLSMAVEFRHGSWLTERHRPEVIGFLRNNGITYVTADEPQYGTLATVPFLPDATTDAAYFRLHGRNREAWLRKGTETSLRYDYLYSGEELGGFVRAARSVSDRASTLFLMFNNCRLGHAMKNALEMRHLVGL